MAPQEKDRTVDVDVAENACLTSPAKPVPGARWLRAAAIAATLAPALAGCAYNISAIGGANDRSASASVGSGGVQAQATGPSGTSTYMSPAPVAAPARDYGPVLRADGTCTQPWTGAMPAAIEPGIAECALVAAKGAPVDVLIGGSGKGQREVQVLYQEPTGKKVYLFSDNRLVRIVD